MNELGYVSVDLYFFFFFLDLYFKKQAEVEDGRGRFDFTVICHPSFWANNLTSLVSQSPHSSIWLITLTQKVRKSQIPDLINIS